MKKEYWFIIVFVLLVVFADIYLYLKSYEIIMGDGTGYYGYLPSSFIFHDWNMNFAKPHGAYCISDIGRIVLRNPMGTSILEFPFFITAHILTLITDIDNARGDTLPYHISISVSTLFYYLLGIIFCYKTLIQRFSQNITLMSLTAISFGCGIFFYTTHSASYSHVYSFALISIFIYLVTKEEKYKNEISYYIGMGILLGLIFLVRNINILIIIFWIFYGTFDVNSIKTRLKTLLRPEKVIPGLLFFIIALIPQMVYWKIQTGHFIVNTYKFQHILCYYDPGSCFKEHFDYLTPHIINGLFSWKKGLFIYYPAMLFAVFGLFKSKKEYKEIFLSSVLLLLPVVYFISAWSEWWYGFSFGQRPYIDYMGLFAILIAIALDFVKNTKSKTFYRSVVAVLIILIIISLFFMFLTFTPYSNADGTVVLF